MQTSYVLELYCLLPQSYRTAANTRFANYGYGQNVFKVGLSGTGEPPIQAYHAMLAMQFKHLPQIKWIANNAPRAWLWLRARTEFLTHDQARFLARLRQTFDSMDYQDLSYTTRENAYIHLSTQPIDVAAALQWIHNNSDPATPLMRPVRPA